VRYAENEISVYCLLSPRVVITSDFGTLFLLIKTIPEKQLYWDCLNSPESLEER